MSKGIELTEPLQRGNSFCEPDPHAELITAFERKQLNRFEQILEHGLADKSLDVNHWYGDPYYGTLLDICCRSPNNHQFVRALLSNGARSNVINRLRKKAPLHVAIEYSDYETIKLLLSSEDQRPDVNLPDNAGNCALHLAAKLNNVDLIELLLNDPRTQINKINRKGQTALHVAILEDSKDVIGVMLKRNDVDVDDIKTLNGKTGRELITEKYPAAGEFQQQLRELKKNSSSAATTPTCLKDCSSDTLFSYLYHRDISSFMNALPLSAKSKRVDLSCSNDGSYTYLQYACNYGLSDVVQRLLDAGVNPNECCPANSKPPIMIAAYNGYINIVRSLVENNVTTYRPVNGETVLHSVVNGVSFCQGVLGCAPDEERNYREVLKCLLSKIGRDKININEKDVKGNTALHYAAKVADAEIILTLLRYGAYIGEKNMLGESAFINIPYKIFQRYLDECIGENDKLPREDNYEIIFKYNFLVPPRKCYVPAYKSPTRFESANDNVAAAVDTVELPHSKCETAPLNTMTEYPELRPLLKHPVLASFVNLKWYTIRKYFYLNTAFYVLFWLLLTFYIFTVYSATKRAGAAATTTIGSNSSTDTAAINAGGKPAFVNGSKLELTVWSITMLFSLILTVREFIQFVVSPVKYVSSAENWLEFGLIVSTFLILCRTDEHDTRQFSAIAILLSWTELVLLIGRHPLLSTNIEMFKTVCYNFLKFLAWYSIFILAFALSFYLLFKDDDSNDNFFRDPAISIFKSVVMTTGEFDASSIPFAEHPGTSHILFILFVFLIAIVLFNLLNGLAVNDTQSIRANAELVSYVSRVKLISYFESMMSGGKRIPSTDDVRKALRCCCCVPVTTRSYKRRPRIAPSYSFYERINLFPHVLSDNLIRVLTNQECRVVFVNPKTGKPREDTTVSCLGVCTSWFIDPIIVKSAKVILADRLNQPEQTDHHHQNVNLLEQYKIELENYKRQLTSAKRESEETKQMLREILQMLRDGSRA